MRPPRDLSTVVSEPDLRSEVTDGSTDFGKPQDLAMPRDLTVLSDLTAWPDLTTPPDLTVPPDLSPTGPVTGGPCVYTGRDMKTIHANMPIGKGVLVCLLFVCLFVCLCVLVFVFV